MADIGGILSGTSALINSGTGIASTVLGASQSKQNLEFQKQQFAYQKELNNQYIDRMDNRLQYMVKDAKKAGINPLAAIGQSGGYSGQSSAPAPQQDGTYLEHLRQIGGAIDQALVNAKIVSDTKVAQSQANLIGAQILNTTEDTQVKNATKKQLLHDLNIANEMNMPIGVLPDVTRDLYQDWKTGKLDVGNFFAALGSLGIGAVAGGVLPKLVSGFIGKAKKYGKKGTDFVKKLVNGGKK